MSSHNNPSVSAAGDLRSLGSPPRPHQPDVGLGGQPRAGPDHARPAPTTVAPSSIASLILNGPPAPEPRGGADRADGRLAGAKRGQPEMSMPPAQMLGSGPEPGGSQQPAASPAQSPAMPLASASIMATAAVATAAAAVAAAAAHNPHAPPGSPNGRAPTPSLPAQVNGSIPGLPMSPGIQVLPVLSSTVQVGGLGMGQSAPMAHAHSHSHPHQHHHQHQQQHHQQQHHHSHIVSSSPQQGPAMKIQKTQRDFSSSVRKKLNSSSRTGQACDRCKVRKIRCDATPGGCTQCRQNSTACRTTDRITGRTTTRGYSDRLETENQALRTRLAEREQQLRDLGHECHSADLLSPVMTVTLTVGIEPPPHSSTSPAQQAPSSSDMHTPSFHNSIFQGAADMWAAGSPSSSLLPVSAYNSAVENGARAKKVDEDEGGYEMAQAGHAQAHGPAASTNGPGPAGQPLSQASMEVVSHMQQQAGLSVHHGDIPDGYSSDQQRQHSPIGPGPAHQQPLGALEPRLQPISNPNQLASSQEQARMTPKGKAEALSGASFALHMEEMGENQVPR